MRVNALSWADPAARSERVTIDRREVGPHDVLINLRYSGVCHSDVNHARQHMGHTFYPIVPGHEMTGHVESVGPEVTRFAVGDRVGIGTLVDSCRECVNCRNGRQSYCRVAKVLAYNARGRDGRITMGGYSTKIVVDEGYVLRIPEALGLDVAAPLLCVGITMYSPLRRWAAGPGTRTAIIGFGGLGHIGVQIAHALGTHTTVFDTAPGKEADARRLGADAFVDARDPATYTAPADSFDLIVSSVPAGLDLDATLGLLAFGGTLVNLGAPDAPLSFGVYSLLMNQRSLSGSLAGGIPQTQEMVDFCASRGIGAELEMIDADETDTAFDRLEAGDVRYRFVIDLKTL